MLNNFLQLGLGAKVLMVVSMAVVVFIGIPMIIVDIVKLAKES